MKHLKYIPYFQIKKRNFYVNCINFFTFEVALLSTYVNKCLR